MQKIKMEVPLPKEITTIMKVRGKELRKALRKIIALELFREGTASIGKAAEIAGISRHQMLDLLAEKKIPLHYSSEELIEDLRSLEKI